MHRTGCKGRKFRRHRASQLRLSSRGARKPPFRDPRRARMLYQTENGETMPADKLGRYMTSAAFLRRANAAVAQAVRALEARGIRPAYLDRSTGQIAGDEIDIHIEDDAVRNVLNELLTIDRTELRQRVVAFGRVEGGPRLVREAVRAVASCLLLAKTAMADEEAKFQKAIDEQMACIRPHAVLVDLAHLMINVERATVNDAFRNGNIISDALYERRVKLIEVAVRH
jgi:hypothetical protein